VGQGSITGVQSVKGKGRMKWFSRFKHWLRFKYGMKHGPAGRGTFSIVRHDNGALVSKEAFDEYRKRIIGK